jgi:hypothetical protein
LTGLTVGSIIPLIAKRDESNLSKFGTRKKAGTYKIYWGFRIPDAYDYRSGEADKPLGHEFNRNNRPLNCRNNNKEDRDVRFQFNRRAEDP